MDELEAVLRDIQDMEDAIRELKERLCEIPRQMATQIVDEEALQNAAAYLYWRMPEVPTQAIRNGLLGTDDKQFRKIVGKARGTITCDRCGKPIAFRSRTHMKDVIESVRKGRAKYAEGYTVLCDPCWQEVQAERTTKYRQDEVVYRERLHKLKTMPYREYLQTPEWQQRRKQHLRSAGYRCQVCNASGVPLNVHHRTYERRGEERYKDLIALCQDCHELFHREGRLAEW
jgi:5-methylcytosine-specific restriction endonuclease McrA